MLVEFYSTPDGKSELWDFLDDLQKKAVKNKDAFFCFKNDTYILLHHFRKKTKKTPPCEIIKAKAERDDWIIRKG